MKKTLEPIIEGHPYPKLYGHGYRCCIGGKWYDCDRIGNVSTVGKEQNK